MIRPIRYSWPRPGRSETPLRSNRDEKAGRGERSTNIGGRATVEKEGSEEREREKEREGGWKGWPRERGRNALGRTYEKNCPRCTQAQRGCSRTRVRGTYTVPSARTLPSPPTMHPHFRVRPPSKNPFNHTHTWVARGDEHTRGAKTARTDVHQYNGGRSRRFRNADTQRQAGYVGNPASPPHPTAATPVVLPPTTTTPVAPSFHGCEPL